MGLSIESLGNATLMVADYTGIMYFPLIENDFLELEDEIFKLKLISNATDQELEKLRDLYDHFELLNEKNQNVIDFLYKSDNEADDLILDGQLLQYGGIVIIASGVANFIYNMPSRKKND